MNRTPAPIIVPSVQRSPQAWSKEPVALWSETEWSNPGCAGLLTGHKLSLSNEPLSKMEIGTTSGTFISTLSGIVYPRLNTIALLKNACRLVHTLFGQSRAKGIGKDYKVAEPDGAIPIQIVPCIIPLIALTQPEPCRKL